MYVEQHTIQVLTDASGNFTGYTPPVTGRILQVRYIPDGTAPLDGLADLDITGADTGVVIVDKNDIGSVAFTAAPRQPTHDAALAASLYAASGEPVEDAVVVAQERLKLVIAQGGAAKSGTFHIWVG